MTYKSICRLSITNNLETLRLLGGFTSRGIFQHSYKVRCMWLARRTKLETLRPTALSHCWLYVLVWATGLDGDRQRTMYVFFSVWGGSWSFCQGVTRKYLLATTEKGFKWFEKFRKPLESDFPHNTVFPGIRSPKAYLGLLKKYMAIAPYVFPREHGNVLSRPTLRYPGMLCNQPKKMLYDVLWTNCPRSHP